ncbi:MAG: cell division protein ZapB [Acidobacteriota bacterium]|jgi:chromosome segregation ATPase|nr:cell division protein ZapB [Acidobacteriota bacterium]
MGDTKLQWVPAGLERFGHLEDKIFRAVEEFKALRKETASLRAENAALKSAAAGAEAALAENGRLREQVRSLSGVGDALRAENVALAEKAKAVEPLQGEIADLKERLETKDQSETELLDVLAKFEKEREEMRKRMENLKSMVAALYDDGGDGGKGVK